MNFDSNVENEYTKESLPINSKSYTIVFYSNSKDGPLDILRILSPVSYLGLRVVMGVEYGLVNINKVREGDIVVIQRDFCREFKAYEQIIEMAHQLRKPIVFDIDDLLFFLPENHPDRNSQQYTEALLPMFQAVLEADYITVTTPKLRDTLLKINNNVIVLPNYFADAIWKLREPVVHSDEGWPLIIGYMGSESHTPDVTFIAPVLSKLLERFTEKIQIHFWGVKPPNDLAGNPQVKWIPSQTYEYIDFATYFQTQRADIFIAPLVDNLFNQAKSPLKFFEYTALGVPGVYSRLDPFEQVITHGYDGLLASSQDEWLDNLSQLIESKEMRYQIAVNAQKTIRARWLLSQNAHQWQEVYERFINEYKSQVANNLEIFALVKSLNQQYHTLNEMREKELHEKEDLLQSLTNEILAIKISRSWKIALLLRRIRTILFPPNTIRHKVASNFLHWLLGQKIILTRRKRKAALDSLLDSNSRWIECKAVDRHKESIDIIICVHNALEDVRKCLESVIAYATNPYSVIIVDDGSDEQTREYLSSFVSIEPRCELIRNDKAKGYTLAANMGMRASRAAYLVLLNSDTIVGPEWIDRMYRAISRDKKIGVVGPLSNTASWQSVPELSVNGDWATNMLPPNFSVLKMSNLISKYSACILPEVPLLNGFCMMIRKALIEEIGYFDEDNFGQGYGEEDDFNLRAGKAGWKKVISDDVYIYHAQSRSYSNQRRYILSKQSGEKLQKKHGIDLVTESISVMNPNRVMEGLRSRTNVMLEREITLENGRERYSGKKLLFILPVIDAGGGANVIIDEARYMIQMGVDVRIFNLTEYKARFLQNYPDLDVPLVFGNTGDLEKIATNYNAVVASANYSVEWLKPLLNLDTLPTLGYYVQGFEPLMYPERSKQAKQALETYTMISGCKRFTKTEWTRQMVFDHTKADSDVIGISVNIDLFQPRDMIMLGVKPVTIVAMIRPMSPYRSPEMTLKILKQVHEKFGKDVDIWLFGANDIRDVVDHKYLDFAWKQLGKLTQRQVASMMSKADIFTDFSSHQAMGLSALEAMSAGCSVIVPKNGGAVEFVHDRKNGIVTDTSNFLESLHAVEELVEDDNLRQQLQLAGIRDVVQYYPEKASYNILKTLFG